MGSDLTLKAVIESTLDAKGFQEFKGRIEETAAKTAAASQQVGALGIRATDSATRLRSFGLQIPNAGVAIFTQNLLLATGNASGLGRAVSVASQGIGALALAIPGVGLGVGVLLGVVGSLIPLLVASRKETEELGAASRDAAAGSAALAGDLRALRLEYDNLTPSLERLLSVKEREARVDQLARITNLIKERVELGQNINAIQDRIRFEMIAVNVAGSLEKAEGVVRERLAALNAELVAAQERQKALTSEIEAETEARRGGAQSITDQIDALQKLGAEQEKQKQLGVKAAQKAANQDKSIQEDVDAFFERRFEEQDKTREEAAKLQEEAQLEEQRIRFRTTQTAKEAEEAKKLAAEQAISSTFGLLTAAFPKSKALSIAEAIINTLQGATKALAQGGILGIGLAAAVLTFGFAQVARIRETEAGGFDLPRSDMLARRFGEKWARDFLVNVDAGFVRSLGHLRTPGAGPVTNLTRNTTINRGTSIGTVALGGFFGTNETELLKQLSRRLSVIDRLERRATLR